MDGKIVGKIPGWLKRGWEEEKVVEIGAEAEAKAKTGVEAGTGKEEVKKGKIRKRKKSKKDTIWVVDGIAHGEFEDDTVPDWL